VGYTYVDFVVQGKVPRNVRALVDTGLAYVVLDYETIFEVGRRSCTRQKALVLF